MLFNAPEDDPTAGLDLDDLANLEALERRIGDEGPGLVFIDTVGMTTDRKLGRPEEANAYFAPLMEIAIRTGTIILLKTHLSQNGEALGRRIVGACRVVWKLTNPDPEGQPDRRRLWVDKTYAKKPPPLGVTIAEAGCSFDFGPPSAPEPNRGGRPPEERIKAEQFIREALASVNDRTWNDLRAEWVKAGGKPKTFGRAVDEMKEAGILATDGGPGMGKQMTLHLINPVAGAEPEAAEPDPDQPF